MANTKISQLPAATSLTTADLVPVVQGGVTKQVTADLLPVSAATTAALSTNSTTDRARANHTGTQTADTITDGTTNKAYTAGEKTKLAGIAAGATVNRADTATDAAIAAATAALVNAAPSTLDTLGELATALTADEGAAATLTTLVGTKAPLASPAFTGTPTISGTAVAKTSDVTTAIATQATTDSATYAPLPKPGQNALTGWYHADGYGAVGDCQQVRDAVTTSGSKVITSATAAFSQADVGKTVSIYPLPPGALVVQSTIASVQSATQATLAANAGNSQTGARMTWGTDNRAALQAWLSALPAKGALAYLPIGRYATTGPIVLQDRSYVTIRGAQNGMQAPQFGTLGYGSQIISLNDSDGLHLLSTATTIGARMSGCVIEDIGIFDATFGSAGIGMKVIYTATGGGATDTLVLRGVTIGGFGTGYWQQYADSTLITGCWISENPQVANIHSEYSIYLRVQDTVLADGGDNIVLSHDYGPRISENIISHGGFAVVADNCYGLRVSDNKVLGTHKQSVSLTNCAMAQVQDNVLAAPLFDAILLTGTDDSKVEGNTIVSSGQGTDLTYDGIRLVGSSRNTIRSNTVRQIIRTVDTATSSVALPTMQTRQKTRYAVNISDAASMDNLVESNDLFASAVLGYVHDSGTRTRIGAGNSTGGTVYDTFTRTNSTSPGVSDSGATWTAVAGTWATNGVALYVSGPTAATSLAYVDAGVSDAVVTARFQNFPGDAGPAWRITDVNNHFAMVASNGANALVYRITAGNGALLATFAQILPGDEVTIALKGSQHIIFVNGTQVTQFTDTQGQTETKHGARQYATQGTSYDRFWIY